MNKNITDAGLQYLKNIHTLDLSENEKITDDGLQYLMNIHTLNLWNNNIAVQAKDNNDNYGTFSDIFTVVYDSHSPEFHQLTPSPNSSTNEQQPVIGAIIKDIHGSIDPSTIYFNFGGL